MKLKFKQQTFQSHAVEAVAALTGVPMPSDEAG